MRLSHVDRRPGAATPPRRSRIRARDPRLLGRRRRRPSGAPAAAIRGSIDAAIAHMRHAGTDEDRLLRAAQAGRPSGAFRRPAAGTGAAEGAARRGPRRVRRVASSGASTVAATGDARRDSRRSDSGSAERLVRRLRRPAARPDIWFTYHLYHKAPDWLGPAVSRALDIPYVVAEASVAAKQRDGKWAIGYAGSIAAIEAAAATIFFNPVDVAGVGECCAVRRGRTNSCRRSSTSRRSPRASPRLRARRGRDRERGEAIAADHRRDDAARERSSLRIGCLPMRWRRSPSPIGSS